MRLAALPLLVALAQSASTRKDRCDECAELLKRVEQLEKLLATKADVMDILSTEKVLDGLKALNSGTNGSQFGAACPTPASIQNQVGRQVKVIQESYQDDLMTIGVQLNSLEATLLEKADSGTVMSRREVLERFQLFEAARNVKLKDLEEALSRKADAGIVMTRKEVHERFQMYHAAQMKVLQAALAEKADAKSTISRMEVHGRFEQVDRAIQNLENISSTLASQSREATRVILEEPNGSLLSSVLWFLAVGFSMMMAFLSLCIVLGECKINHQRLAALEERVLEEEEEPRPKPVCDLRLLALEDIKEEGPKLRTKVLSGAVGAAIGTTTGAISGSAVGGTVGAAIGLVPAVFTFGLSIPVGALLGSGIGLASGGVVGGSAGAVGGVKAAKWIKRGQRPSFSSESLPESLSSFQSRSVLQQIF